MCDNPKLWFFACMLFAAISTVSAAQKPVVCNQQYAICTSAQCIPDPRHSGFALCSCDVKEGNSAGYSACAKRKPAVNKDKTTRIISTFSFAQFDSKKGMACGKGFDWTNCVDSPCTVDPMNPAKATCSCPVLHGQAFVTFGGDCNIQSCSTGFWSGATIDSSTQLREVMQKSMGATTNPYPTAACPTH
ncbi:MAG: hypothetical protein ABI597_00710 [Gammaproteobacteria bacterium]